MIIHLNGWPGAGKKTVGERLAARFGARFIHNHLLHDVAIVCAGLDGPDRWPLYEAVRSAAYAMLRRRPREETFVMTNALTAETRCEVEVWNHVVDLAIDRQVALVPVVLHVEAEENARRLRSHERVGRKLTDPEHLCGYFGRCTLQYPAVPERLVLDTMALPPDAAAAAIERHVDAVRNALMPATDAHRRLARRDHG